MELIFDDGNQHVGGHGAPDLRLHRVLARAQKTFDAQMLLACLSGCYPYSTNNIACN